MSLTVCFFSPDHKCGCSMLSLCVAKTIARICPSLKVLLIHSMDCDSEIYSPGISENLSRIRPYINEKIVEYSEIVKNAKYEKNLYIIGGEGVNEVQRKYDIGGFETFILGMKNYMDIIICDDSADITNSKTLASLYQSDCSFLVLNQLESCFRRYELYKGLFEKLNINFYGYVLNKYDKNNVYSIKYCVDRLQTDEDKIFTVALSEYGNNAEMEQKILLEYNESKYKWDIEKISRRIIGQYGKI